MESQIINKLVSKIAFFSEFTLLMPHDSWCMSHAETNYCDLYNAKKGPHLDSSQF